MKRFIYSCFFIFIVQHTIGQHYDSLAIQCIERQDIFGLQDVYVKHKYEIQDSFIHKMTGLYYFHYYNRTDSIAPVAVDLLRYHQNKLGSRIVDCIHIFAHHEALKGEYHTAANLLNTLLRAIKEGGDSTSQHYTSLKALSILYKKHGDCSPIMQYKTPTADIRIPFKIKGTIQSKCHINGTEEDITWDTAAGRNFMNKETADKLGLKTHRIPGLLLQGHRLVEAELAFVDSFSIGKLIFRNVPFLITDPNTGHPKADSILNKIKIIAGIPFMQKFREIQFDFKKNQIIIPGKLTPPPFALSNVCFTDAGTPDIRVQAGNTPLNLIFDTGATYCTLFSTYYNKHKHEIQEKGIPDTLRIGGIGGWSRVDIYKLNEFKMAVAQKQVCLDSISVQVGPEQSSTCDGIFGLLLFRSFDKVIFNLKDMFVKVIP